MTRTTAFFSQKKRKQFPLMKGWHFKQQVFIRSVAWLVPVLGLKLLVHAFGLEFVVASPLHTSAVAGGFFVLGFLLSAAIADFKECERLPADFTAIIENMCEDASLINRRYPFDFEQFRKRLLVTVESLRADLVEGNRETHHHVYALGDTFAEMEAADVPPNYIGKLKQEQGQLVRGLFRMNYIQSIQSIPSAYFLAEAVVVGTVGLLLFTAIEPFTSSLVVVALIAFVFIYILRLVRVVSTPFHPEGSTQDDVSLFQIERTVAHLQRAHRGASPGR
jgi:hypothetical protein